MNICPSGLMDYSTIPVSVQQIVIPGIQPVIPVPVKPPETSLPIILKNTTTLIIAKEHPTHLLKLLIKAVELHYNNLK